MARPYYGAIITLSNNLKIIKNQCEKIHFNNELKSDKILKVGKMVIAKKLWDFIPRIQEQLHGEASF